MKDARIYEDFLRLDYTYTEIYLIQKTMLIESIDFD